MKRLIASLCIVLASFGALAVFTPVASAATNAASTCKLIRLNITLFGNHLPEICI